MENFVEYVVLACSCMAFVSVLVYIICGED